MRADRPAAPRARDGAAGCSARRRRQGTALPCLRDGQACRAASPRARDARVRCARARADPSRCRALLRSRPVPAAEGPMTELSLKEFGAYFEAVHAVAPFPWQARLLGEIAKNDRWPVLLDLPTGAGKTAAI